MIFQKEFSSVPAVDPDALAVANAPAGERLDMTNQYNTTLTEAEEKQYQEWAKKEGRELDTFDYDLRGAWKEMQSGTMSEDARGHLGDKYKKPNHPTFSDQSIYNGVSGIKAGRWSVNEQGKNVYTPGRELSMDESRALSGYFERVEPDSVLNLEGNKPKAEGDSTSWYTGTLDALWKGVGSGYHETVSAYQGALSWAYSGTDYEKYLDEQSAEHRKIAKEEYSIDPVKGGLAANLVYSVTNGLTKYVPGLVLGGTFQAVTPFAPGSGALIVAPLFGANVGIFKTQSEKDANVDERTAQKEGMSSFFINTIGALAPAGVGSNVLTRAFTGGVMGAGTNYFEQATLKTILENADYQELADRYDPANPVDNAASFLMGGVFGAVTPHTNLSISERASIHRLRVQEKNLTNRYRDELMKTGKFTKEEATTQASLNARAAVSFARVTGQEVDEIAPKVVVSDDGSVGFRYEQPAWHGTPYLFDRFDSAHMGSGEGAQAHGYGHYLAGERSVAEGYRNRISQKKLMDEVDEVFDSEFGSISEIDQAVAEGQFDAQTTSFLQAMKKDGWLGFDNPHLAIRMVFDQAYGKNHGIELSPELEKAAKDYGRLMEVDVPEMNVLLDEDLPLRSQPESVQKAMTKLLGLKTQKEDLLQGEYEFLRSRELSFSKNVYKFEKAIADARDFVRRIPRNARLWDMPKGEGEALERALADSLNPSSIVEISREIQARLHPKREFDPSKATPEGVAFQLFDLLEKAELKRRGLSLENPSGREMYRLLSGKLGSAREASHALEQEGVRGITYDGKQDGRCFVVFDDEAVKVTEFFQRDADVARGSFSPAENTIRLTKNADISTFSHEHSHWYLTNLMSVATNPKAAPSVREDAASLLKAWGIKSIREWDALGLEGQRKFQEQFAGWTEVYLSEGKAPTKGLKGVFERLGKWIKDLYRDDAQGAVGARHQDQFGEALPELSPDVRRVLDRMYSNEERAATKQGFFSKHNPLHFVVKQKNPKSAPINDIDVEDSARLRAQQIASESKLPVNHSDESALQRSRGEMSRVSDDFQNGRRVNTREADPETIERIRSESLKRLAEQSAKDGNVLQNRDRSSKESVAQMRGIASRPDYLRVSVSNSLSDGAPVVTDTPFIAEMQKGDTVTIVDSSGCRYEAQYAVVDADTVVTSNDINGTPNPMYGVENPDVSFAVAGNGRVTAFNHAYDIGTMDGYRKEFTADARHGVDPTVIEQMKKPILVRLVKRESLPADIADRTNTRSTAELNKIEQAINDAQRVDLRALSFTEDGNISLDTVTEFVALMPESERGRLVVDGVPTAEAWSRLDAAIFQAAYKSPGLTELLDSSLAPRGIATMLKAYRAMAPRLLDLDGMGKLDITRALSEVLNELQSVKASGKRMSLHELAGQGSIDRSPMAQVFFDYFAKAEEERIGYRQMVDDIGATADIVRGAAEAVRIEEASGGAGMFGDRTTLSERALMRDFAKRTNMKLDETQFMDTDSLHGAMEVQSEVSGQNAQKVRDVAYLQQGYPLIEKAPRMELITVAKDENGVHRVWGVNGNPDLTVLPEGIQGVKPLPVRLQESTMNRDHILKHEKELATVGYESVMDAIWDVVKNYDQIWKGTLEGKETLRLTRKILVEEDGRLARGVLQVEFMEVAGAYRVGSVYLTKKNRFMDEKALLWERSPTIRGPFSPEQPTLTLAPTRDLTRPEKAFTHSIGEEVGDVNEIKGIVEISDMVDEAKANAENIEQVKNATSVDDSLNQEVLMVLEDQPEILVASTDRDGNTTHVSGASHIANEDARAEALSQQAEGITTAAMCALINNGVK